MEKKQTESVRDIVRIVMLRELRALDREIAAYPDDESLWQTPAGVSNSAGNLALHLQGNLRHFIGSVLGQSGYVRDRDAEFAVRGLSRDALRKEVQSAISELDAAFDRITDEQIEADYPLPLQGRKVRTHDFIVHLCVHLAYHLGQLDYHRRIVTGNPEAAGAISILELPEA